MDKARAQKLAELLYQDSNGYAVSKRGKEAIGLHDDKSFTYGEISFETFATMIPPELRHGNFYDLGSGTGKAVIMAALLGGFSKTTGIELVPDLWKESERIRERFNRIVAPLMKTEEPVPTIGFRQADFLITDWSDADCIFVQGTCMPNDLLKQLSQKLERLESGSTIIIASSLLPTDKLVLERQQAVQLGWGKATILYYRRP